MAKIILLAVIFFVAHSLFKHRAPKQSDPKSEDMVKCAHCGVYQPRNESIAAGEHFFCCDEHRQLHAR
ncbi:MAG: PP0621 family protein [Burkholderiales bacterium]